MTLKHFVASLITATVITLPLAAAQAQTQPENPVIAEYLDFVNSQWQKSANNQAMDLDDATKIGFGQRICYNLRRGETRSDVIDKLVEVSRSHQLSEERWNKLRNYVSVTYVGATHILCPEFAGK